MDQGSIIRESRIGRKMTQEHLAMAACVSKRTIIRAEQNRQITTETLRSICAVLGMDAEDLSEAQVSAERSPKEILTDMISATGETIVWSDAASAEGFRRESAIEICEDFSEIVAMTFIAGLTVPFLWLYAFSRIATTTRIEDIAAFALTVVWFVFVISSFRMYLAYSANRSEEEKALRNTFHVLTDKAFYCARQESDYDEDGRTKVFSLASVRRIGLPEDRSGIRDVARYHVWPKARYIRIGETREERMDIIGVRDISGLSELMREGMRTAA